MARVYICIFGLLKLVIHGIRVASVIEFCVCMCVDVFWANFLISGRRHVIVARVTIKFVAGVNLKTHYQTNCNECAKRFCGRRES